jgi:hypothetical protein
MKILDVKEDEMLTLRATHAKFFNDPYEYNYAISLLETSMKRYERENSIEIRKSKSFDKKGIRSFGIVAGHPFILSFSENSDDLTMWRTYGFDGKGVAIGLDKNMLVEYCKDKNTTNTALIKCAYKKEAILANLTTYWEEWYDRINFENKVTSVDSFSFFFQISVLCFSIKRAEYSVEKEWRLCKNEWDLDNIRFLEKDGLIVPYVEHHLPRSIIKKIVIGPCVNKSLTNESIDIFLRTRKYEFEKGSIVMSRVPYRRF